MCNLVMYVTQISRPRPVSEMRAPLGTMMVMTLVLLTWAHNALASGKQLEIYKSKKNTRSDKKNAKICHISGYPFLSTPPLPLYPISKCHPLSIAPSLSVNKFIKPSINICEFNKMVLHTNNQLQTM